MYIDLGEQREKIAKQMEANQEEVMTKARRQQMHSKLAKAASETMRQKVHDPQYENNVNQNMAVPLNAKDPKESNPDRVAKDAAERACLNLAGKAKDECLDRVRTTMKPIQPETKAKNPLDRLANPHAVDDGSVPPQGTAPTITLPEPNSAGSPIPEPHGKISDAEAARIEGRREQPLPSTAHQDRIAAAEKDMNVREARPIAAKAAALAADKVVVAAKTEHARLEEAAAAGGGGGTAGGNLRFKGADARASKGDPKATPPVDDSSSAETPPPTPIVTVEGTTPLHQNNGAAPPLPPQPAAATASVFGNKLPEEKIAAQIAQKMGLKTKIIPTTGKATLDIEAPPRPPRTIGPDCHTGMSVHRWGDDSSSLDTGRLELPPCKAVSSDVPVFDAKSPWAYFPTNVPSAEDLAAAAAGAAKARNAAFAASQAAEKGDLDGASEALNSALAAANLTLAACQDTTGSEKARIACRAAKSALNAAEGAQEAQESAEKGDVHGALAGLDRSRSGGDDLNVKRGAGSSSSGKKGGGATGDIGGTVAYDEPPSSSGRNGRADANNDGRHADVEPPYREKFHLPPPGPIPWPFDDKTKVPLPFPFGRFKEVSRAAGTVRDHRISSGGSDASDRHERGSGRRRALLMLPMQGALDRHNSETLLDPSLVKGDPDEDPTLPGNRPYHDPRMDPFTLEDEANNVDINTWEGPANEKSDLKMLSEMTVCLNEADEGLGQALFEEMSRSGTVVCQPLMANRAYSLEQMQNSVRL
jgi:hypothetical protein